MNAQKRVMLLIDADNVSAGVIEQAIAKVLAEHGAIHVRRAYCTAESAVTHQKLFKAHSIRPIVNLSSGKNANDIALAVDAMDLAVAERPDVAVIVSSDSDFAPLVIRLREKGCRVEGIGQKGKTGDDSKPVYDNFVDLLHQKKPEAAPSAPRKRAAPARKAPAVVAKPAPKPAAPALPDDVQRILAAIPELRGGAKLELRIAAERLRADGLLTKNAPSTKLFKKYIDFFDLTPERQPNKVQYRAR
ncbi:MAG: NYN domain-containing protein [Rhizobacter sp.]|nr:NYN domain-containing protein [Rhizobacter sp.]